MALYDDEIRNEYPQLAWLLNEPEVGAILREAYAALKAGRPWTETQLNGRIQATNWWKNNSASMRGYHTLANTDPAKFWQAVQSKADQITDMAAQLGLDLTPEQIYEAAKAALYFGRSDADVKRALVYGSGATISDRSSVQARVKSLAASYFIALSDADVKDWTLKISSGQYTEYNLAAQLQSWSKAMYPQFAKQLDSGLTMADIAAPYRSRIAQTLEISPDQVNLATDPRWKRVLNHQNPDGSLANRPMTDYETDQYVRSLPEFRPTRQARTAAAELGELITVQMGEKAA